MNRAFAFLAVIMLTLPAGMCHKDGERVRTISETVPVEVQVPCPAQLDPRPPVRPLPSDLEALAATLAGWLKEYTAPGGWADQARAAVDDCNNAAPE